MAEIGKTVDDVFEENKNVILEERYRTNGSFSLSPSEVSNDIYISIKLVYFLKSSSTYPT